MKQLINTSDKEWTIPGVQGCFYPGAGKPIGTGPGEVPQAIADRFALYPGWAVKDVAEAGAGGAPGINASKQAIAAAEAAGVDLSAITGTGQGNQITKADVTAYVATLPNGKAPE